VIRGRNIHEDLDRGVLTLWLDRREAKNGMDPAMLEEFAAAVERAAAAAEARAVVVRGANGDFCTGADLGDMETPVLETSRNSIELVQRVAAIFAALHEMGKPTVAAVEGWAVAGGFEIVISCDFALAAADARLGDFHIRRALFGGAGPIYRLPRLVGLRRAKELLLTGKIISGAEAARWGLVNGATEAPRLDALIGEFCGELVDKSAFCLGMTKMALNRGLDADSDTLARLATMTTSAVMRSADAGEGEIDARGYRDARSTRPPSLR
jgi:enoyl-CoA hydratase/carnithine racemase